MLAIQLLGDMRSIAALPKFESVLKTEEDLYVVREIINVLLKIGNQQSRELIQELSTHKSRLVREFVEEVNRSTETGYDKSY
jgi:HEAT repeat protein